MAKKKISELTAASTLVEVVGLDPSNATARSNINQIVGDAFDALNVPEMVTEVETLRSEAREAALLAGQHASNPRNSPLADGSFSCVHHKEETRDIARLAPLLTEKEIGESVSSPYTLVADDKFRTLVFNRTTALTVKLPANWHTAPALDGSLSEAWLEAQSINSGVITFVGDSTPVVQEPVLSANQLFTYAVEPAVANVINTHTITAPAGTNRKFIAWLISIHNSTQASRTSVLTATNVSSLTKSPTLDTSENAYGGAAPLPVAAWTGVLADSATSTEISITCDAHNDPLAYALFVAVYNNADEVLVQTPVSTGPTATSISRTTTTTEDKSHVLYGLAMRSSLALPVSLNSEAGTSLYNGKTPLSRGAKEICYIFGTKAMPTAGSVVSTLTSARSDKCASISAIIQPVTTVGVASTLLAPDGATLSAAGKRATIFARSNGATYIKKG